MEIAGISWNSSADETALTPVVHMDAAAASWLDQHLAALAAQLDVYEDGSPYSAAAAQPLCGAWAQKHAEKMAAIRFALGAHPNLPPRARWLATVRALAEFALCSVKCGTQRQANNTRVAAATFWELATADMPPPVPPVVVALTDAFRAVVHRRAELTGSRSSVDDDDDDDDDDDATAAAWFPMVLFSAPPPQGIAAAQS